MRAEYKQTVSTSSRFMLEKDYLELELLSGLPVKYIAHTLSEFPL